MKPVPDADLPADPCAWRVPLAVAVCVFLLVYGAELGQFTLSIDEEVASFMPTLGTVWLSQGRWGMGLLTWLLPNFEAIPLLSTVLFGAGLIFSAMRAIRDFRLEGMRAATFAAVFAGFPLWLHIGEFNTFAAGFGFGVAAASLGAGLATHARDWRARAIGIAAMAFAISIYQTLAVYVAVYALIAWHASIEAPQDAVSRRPAAALFGSLAGTAATVLAAGVAYWTIQKLASSVFGVTSAYVDVYWQVDRLRAAPGEVVATGLRALGDYATGRQDMYLSTGGRVLFLSWLGLLPYALALRARNVSPGFRLGAFWTTLVIALCLVAMPFVVSAGTLPIRAHVAWPLLAAWLASRIELPSTRFFRGALWTALAFQVVAACSIGASLFYTERVVRAADAALTQSLVPRMLDAADASAAGASAASTIPFAISGVYAFPMEGEIQRAGVFGTSFYEHDNGNVRRVALYMKTLGYRRFEPVWLGSRPDLVEAVAQMPDWPAPGSIRRVNGVVLVRLGPATPQQLGPG